MHVITVLYLSPLLWLAKRESVIAGALYALSYRMKELCHHQIFISIAINSFAIPWIMPTSAAIARIIPNAILYYAFIIIPFLKISIAKDYFLILPLIIFYHCTPVTFLYI